MSESKHTLTVWQTGALKCLDHAVRRDAEKGGAGTRSTSEVAEYIGISPNQARGVLYALYERGMVEVYGPSPLEWKITSTGGAAIAKAEPHP